MAGGGWTSRCRNDKVHTGMAWEHHTEPLASRQAFTRRLGRQFALVLLLIVTTLAFGVLGYWLIAGLGFVDALLESSMFLSGAGPIYTERSSGTVLKVFSSFYALFCTLVVVTIVAIVAAPFVHRALHRLHLEKGRRG